MSIPRPEHPRPQLVRERWHSLNGIWRFAIDLGDSGLHRGWPFDPAQIEGEINVPFCPESRLSGVHNTDFLPVVWYHRKFTVPESWKSGRVLLHFGAVDWGARVWLNGHEVGHHRGGSSSFTLDVTDAIGNRDTENSLVVRAQDDVRSGLQPAGKQSVLHQSFAASYTRTTGIWQSVWIECVPETRIDSVQILPDWSNGRFIVLPRLVGLRDPLSLHAVAREPDGGPVVARASARGGDGAPLVLELANPRAWSPADPHLYDLEIELRAADGAGEPVDRVASYAGLRQFHIEGDRFLLNGEPIFLRLVLDQGFYPDGLWTAPSDAELKADIERAQALGFNGARLHQKVFEERFHYWADKLGYLTWGEFCDWGIEGLHFLEPRRDPEHQERALDNHLREWSEIVARDRNHPSIVAWTPFNEANRRKGRTRLYDRAIRKVYEVTKAIDPTRPVHDASGWTHVQTDVYTVHDYEQDPDTFRKRYADGPRDIPEARESFGGEAGAPYAGEPYLVDEYGGTWWQEDAENDASWGYGERPRDSEEVLSRIEGLTAVLLEHPRIAGFCYTQLTDIEQEKNGLYTYDRKPKFAPERLRRIFGAPAAIETRGPGGDDE